ncbi:MAG: hypothetical protein ACK45B_02460 [Limisphaerales bacterium]
MWRSWGWLVAVALGTAVNGQSLESATTTARGGSLTPPAPAVSELRLAERGPHHNTFVRTVTRTEPNGRVVEREVPAYTELASGLNYWEDGEWRGSRAEFELLSGGHALARMGQHKVIISPVLNDLNGAVDLQTPDGRRMRSTILGLALRDRLSGTNLLVAEIKGGVTGQKAAANEILFADCFDNIRADVRFVFQNGAFHQDVILREALDVVWLEQLGFNPKTTRLEIWTEFFEAPPVRIRQKVLSSIADPAVRAVVAEPDVVEEELDFGDVLIPVGHAYAQRDAGGKAAALLVPKRWHQIDGRTFLVESVSLHELNPLFAGLPTTAPGLAGRAAVLYAGRRPPAPKLAVAGTNAILLAGVDRPAEAPGVVLDYQLVAGASSYTFKEDMTYYVSGDVWIGTIIIEGGAVIKYAPGVGRINSSGTVVCKTAPYRPAVLTSKNDNTVGEIIAGSTGTPSANEYYSTGFRLYNAPGVRLEYLRFAHLGIGLNNYFGSVEVRHCQFVKCRYPIDAYEAPATALRNVLMVDVPGDAISLARCSASAEHLTMHSGFKLVNGTDSTFAITNSLLTAVQWWGSVPSVTNNIIRLSSASGVYAAVGAGTRYLATNSPYRNIGTTNIHPALLADLRKKTTYPPVLLSNVTVSTPTVLTQQAARDVDTPDLGYHYEPLDYLVDRFAVTNAPLTITNGVAIGACLNNPGIWLQDGSSISAVGTPDQPIHFTFYNTVQEQPVFLSTVPPTNFTYACLINPYHLGTTLTVGPTGEFRFAKFSSLAATGVPFYHVQPQWDFQSLSVRDCEIGTLYGYHQIAVGTNTTTRFVNNLFRRTTLDVSGAAGAHLAFSNNLFWGGSNVTLRAGIQGTLHAYDNVFDSCHVNSRAIMGGVVHNDFNAYLNCTGGTVPLTNAGPNNLILTNTLAYQTGPLGSFYQPVNSPLRDAGSVSNAAQAGFHAYTTTTNQAWEASSVLDLGYHYVAMDANGLPPDTDSDGLPDYLDPDADGDGLPDAWEFAQFGNLNQHANGDPDYDELTHLQEWQLGTDPNQWDTDGDGLSDSEELTIPVDINQPALGFLNPLVQDTAGTGIPDGEKDSDDDGISNLGELREFGSDPGNPYTYTALKDSEYFLTSRAGASGATMTTLHITHLMGMDLIQGQINGAFPGAEFDLYVAIEINALPPRWKFRRVLNAIQCDGLGYALFRLPKPELGAGFVQFVVLATSDRDNDGLSDGYEAWFTYDGRRTIMDRADSDGDSMGDGWEVAYGLDPTQATGLHGSLGDPDDDGISNVGEHNANPRFAAPSFDPHKPYGSSSSPARPVVSVSSSVPDAHRIGGTASFTITRAIGAGATLSEELKVYYSIGSVVTYGTDFTLTPEPSEYDYPRVFSATIPAGETSVTIVVTPTGSGLHQAGTHNITIKLTPYAVATSPQTANPLEWRYVVDLFQDTVTLRIHDGILINLEKTTSGYLRIKPTSKTTTLPFINVANTDYQTMARIYTGSSLLADPSRVVGEFYTAPGTIGSSPSRTTVDRFGNVWIGNRTVVDNGMGSITQFGIVLGGTRCNADGSPNPEGDFLKPPFIYNTCVDRHGATVNDPPDGLIKTSRGSRAANLVLDWSNANDADTLGGVSTAEDETILRYVRVAPTAVRTIIVDPKNNVWVGSRVPAQNGNGWHEFIDSEAGMPVTGWRVNFQGGGYGGVVDGHGAIWSSGYDDNGLSPALVRFLPSSTMPLLTGGTIRGTGDNYGIGVDPRTGDVWQALHTSPHVMHFGEDRCATKFDMGRIRNRGVVIDARGNVWVGGSDSAPNGQVFRLTTSGSVIGAVPMTFTAPGQSTINGSAPLGVSVDSSGMIWAICNSSSEQRGYAMRIDPDQNPDSAPGHVPPIGRVVEVVDLGGGSGPYNYSDMSGFVALSATQPAGVWVHVKDSGTANSIWDSLTMTADIPAGTRIIVEVRAANSITALPSWPFRPVVNAQGVTPDGITAIPPGIKGRYLEVRANLLRDFGVPETPELRGLTVSSTGAGCGVDIVSHPQSQAVAPGATVTFSVAAVVPEGASATYQWLKDGAAIAGATAATFVVNDASYTHAGRYSVKVGATAGCGAFQRESAPARLHVRGSPPSLVLDLLPTLSVPLGQNAVLTARAAAGSTPGERPLKYQWRFNNEPITGPGASGNCGAGDCDNIQYVVPGQCGNAGVYSVVFWNEYGQVSTTNCEVSIEGTSQVAINPQSAIVVGANQTVDLVAATCLGDVNCVKWYFTKDGKKTEIPPNPPPDDPANLLKYRLPTPITCDQIGEYTVSVADRAWNAYEASAFVSAGNTFGVSITSTTLEITPDDIGSGNWSRQWAFSADGATYADIPGATAASLTVPAESAHDGYYKATAKRSGATAIVRARVQVVDGVPEVLAGVSQDGALKITYTALADDPASVWNYQWMFLPEAGGFEEAIPGATGTQYTVASAGCARSGTYRVQLNCGASATSKLRVNNLGLSSTTLKIVPDDIGFGTWTHTWYSSLDNISYAPVVPNPGTPDYTLPAGELPLPGTYYKVEAARTGATAEARWRYFSDPNPQFGTSVQVVATTSANVNVTYAAGSVGGGGAFHWYFTPLSGIETDTGITASSYTIGGVGCANRGSYRATIADACGGQAQFSVTLLRAGCP